MDKIWWNSIMNAIKYLNDISDCLIDNKSVILNSAAKIPWLSTMNEIIEEKIRVQNSERGFKHIHGDIDNPGKYILDKFCKEEKRAMFRPGMGYAEFLADSDDVVLNDTYVWVENIPPEKLEVWINFVADYNKSVKKRQRRGVFILNAEPYKEIKNTRGIHTAAIDKYIGQYDTYIFNMLLSSSKPESDYHKQYLSDLAAGIAGNRVELSALLVDSDRAFLQDPYKVICNITNNGSDFAFDIPEDEVEKYIWKSQIKIIFPLIEEYRESFIEKYRPKINMFLPIETSYGELLSEPNDVDIGPLWGLVHHQNMCVSEYDHQCIDIFRNARNVLAHIKVLSYEEVEQIFDLF